MILRGQMGLRPPRRGRSSVAVDLTPLIDVTFQLLIFFVLTATFRDQPAFAVNLPKASNREVSREPAAVVVVVSEDGTYEIDHKVVDERELHMRLCMAAEQGTARTVNIKADADARHQAVVKVMDMAKRCKLDHLGILHNRE